MMNELLLDADLCVKCGLCLPHCPTYRHTQNENESPRGRIALIQAWAGQQLDSSAKLLEHIDNCLLCRSCERACPAVVPYGRLLDNFRSEVRQSHHNSLGAALMKKIAHSKKARQFVQKGMKLYQTSPLQKTARMLGLPKLLRLQAIDRLLPDYHEPAVLNKTEFPATSTVRGQVGLFIGCMGHLLDDETVQAAIKVLNIAGYHVIIPEQQVCCGALAAHSGDKAVAEALATQNGQAFGDGALDAIVTIASGCGSQLRDYQNIKFSGKVMDISYFLDKANVDLSGQLLPLAKTVVVHSPCSLKNVLLTEQSVFKILWQIPELTISVLPETLQCCGSAGTYMLDHPNMSQLLLKEVLEATQKNNPDILVTSNIGCSLHIAAGLREEDATLTVLHPVVLIAKQLQG